MNPRASSGLNLNFDLPRRKQRGIKKYNKNLSTLLKLIHIIKKKYIFLRRLVVVERDIGNPHYGNGFITKIDPSGFTVKRVTYIDKVLEEKIRKALGNMDFHPTFDIEEAKKRLKKGYYFIILEHDGQIIGWNWSATGSVYVTEIQKVVKLEKKHAFAFNAYIEKNSRSKGLNKLILQKMLESLYADGFAKIWVFIFSWNYASIKSLVNTGCKISADYYYLRFFFIKIRYRRRRGRQ